MVALASETDESAGEVTQMLVRCSAINFTALTVILSSLRGRTRDTTYKELAWFHRQFLRSEVSNANEVAGSRTASRLGVKPVPVFEPAKRSPLEGYLWDMTLAGC